MTIANFDADLILYRVGFTTQDVESPNIVRSRVDELILNTKEECQTDIMKFYLSDSGRTNFRFEIYPEYKANRPPKPKWHGWIRDYLLDEYEAVVVPRHEADDCMAMFQTEDTICVSIDKDLLQIPGQHYNFVKKEWHAVEEFEGLRWFYRQILMGDSTDNLPGLWRVGPAKTDKLTSWCQTEEDLWSVVQETYDEHGIDISLGIRNGQCMWCYRTPVSPELDNLWQPPAE